MKFKKLVQFDIEIEREFSQRLWWMEPNGFHQWKLRFKIKTLGDFQRVLKLRNCRKTKTNIVTVRKLLKLWIHSSLATLEVHKSESRVKTTYFKHKRNTTKVPWDWFLTTCANATSPRVSILTLSLLQFGAFFIWSPMFASLFLGGEERYPQTVLTLKF